jgi:hypothetical protein
MTVPDPDRQQLLDTPADRRFLEAALAEGGMPISAGYIPVEGEPLTTPNDAKLLEVALSDRTFLEAALAEGGMPVSAGWTARPDGSPPPLAPQTQIIPLPTNSRLASPLVAREIGDSSVPELLCYGFATIFVVAGTFSLIWGAVTDNGIVAAAGAIVSSFSFFVLSAARTRQREKIATRLLVIALSESGTSEDVLNALISVFEKLFVERKVR